MRPTNDPLPAQGAVIQKPAEKPLVSALDETLLGRALPRWPNGISQPGQGISQPARGLSSGKSPDERARLLDEFAPREKDSAGK